MATTYVESVADPRSVQVPVLLSRRQHFIFHGWKKGWSGALRMGLSHGAYCVGCCWGLMLILFALGVMSVFWMVVVAAIIFAEKVTPFGARLSRRSRSRSSCSASGWLSLPPPFPASRSPTRTRPG
jgi:hypothetical protein